MAQKNLHIIVLLTAAALLAVVLCSCIQKEKAAKTPPAPLTTKSVPRDQTMQQKLAKDLVAAGFRPMEPYKARSGEKVDMSGDLVEYANAHFALDKNGRIERLWAGKPNDILTQALGLSSLSINTYKGSNLLLLTNSEITKLYGFTMKANSLKGTNSLFIEYLIGNKASVEVIIGFKKPGDSEKLAWISATYFEGPPRQTPGLPMPTIFYDWPTTK